MVSIENQFRAVALPGDRFTLCVWKTGENEALFRMVKTVMEKRSWIMDG